MNLHRFPNSAVPLPRDQLDAMLETITAMQRVTGAMATALIASLDRIDGDADLEPEPDEPNGDERDGSMGEDDFCIHNTGGDCGAGCPVSDPGGCEHDGREPDYGR